jgi:MFS family permease
MSVSTAVAVERPTYVRYIVLGVLCLGTAINYAQRNCIGPAATTIKADLNLRPQDLGDFISAFFLSYSLLQIPSGWVGQAWGPRRALTVFAVGWSLALGLSALATSAPELVMSRAAMGVLQAGIFSCCTLAFVSWLPATRRAFASAMLNSFMIVGTIAGATLAGWLLGPLGWRGLFTLYAIPGIAWAIGYSLWFRDRPRDHRAVNNAELEIILGQPVAPDDRPHDEPHPVPSTSVRRDRRRKTHDVQRWRRAFRLAAGVASPPSVKRVAVSVVFLSVTMWLIGIQQAFRAGANRFYDNWMPAYLEMERGCTVANAAFLSSGPLWAGFAGGLVGGLLSDWLLKRTGSRRAGRQAVAIGSLLVGSSFFFAAIWTTNVTAYVVLISVGAFVTTFAAPCAYALTMDLGGTNLGIVFGTMNMAGNFGSTAFTWVVPRLNAWGGWNATLYVFAGAHVAAALCWLVVNPNGVIGEQST